MYTHITYSVGYVKDALAVIGFIGAFILIYGTRDLHNVKSIILVSLLIAVIVDVLFTTCPGYHHHMLGYNMPTYILCATMLAFIPILIRFLKASR